MSNTPSIDSAPGSNMPVLTVSELSTALRSVVEDRFALVRVRGEVSGFKRAGSGHCYFSLKDAEAVLDAVCWRTAALRLGMAPEDGMDVVVTGRLTTFPGRSRYQIVVEAMELAGEGALLKLLDDRKRRLADEGLFDAARKRPLPFLPEVIGVVTSPSGAVIRDILHRLRERFPRRVLLWPVRVQGEGAADEIATAIRGFGALAPDGPVPRPDVLIIARGGGSLEDLWAFNEEAVARAAAASPIPLISAVGHETDTTLIDYAADLRAPTPTAAAELAVPVRATLATRVIELGNRLYGCTVRQLDRRGENLQGLARGLPDLPRLLEIAAQRLDDRAERLGNALVVGLDRKAGRLDRARLRPPRERILRDAARVAGEARALDSLGRGLLDARASRLERAGALLESFSYQRVLERGFALVRDRDDMPLVSAREVKPGEVLTLTFKDGDAAVLATGTPPQRRRRRRADGRQGTLL